MCGVSMQLSFHYVETVWSKVCVWQRRRSTATRLCNKPQRCAGRVGWN